MCVFCLWVYKAFSTYVYIYILIVSIVSSMYRERGFPVLGLVLFSMCVCGDCVGCFGVSFFGISNICLVEMIDLFSDKHKQSNTYRYLSERSENNERKNRN